MYNTERTISIFNPCVSNFGSIKSLFRHYEIKAQPVFVGDTVRTNSLLICGVSGLQFDDKEYLIQLRKWIHDVHESGRQIVGICAGMQMLFDKTEEVDQPLLGLLRGSISKLQFKSPELVTFIGFRNLQFENHEDVKSVRAYFAHGYGLLKPADGFFEEEMIYKVNEQEYGVGYFQKDNILGFQFHPEKSSPEAIDFFINKLVLGYAS